MQRVLEYPWIIERAAANAHAGATRLVQHLLCGLWSGDVPVANDRDSLDRPSYCPNSIKIDHPREPCSPAPAVNKTRRHSDILQRPSQIRRGNILVIPAQSHLG